MIPRRWELLKTRAMQRFAVEFIAIILGVIVVYQFVLEPVLLARFPAVLPSPSVSETGRSLPDTRSGWLQVLILGAVTVPIYYYRMYRTELGEQLRETVHDEMGRDRRG